MTDTYSDSPSDLGSKAISGVRWVAAGRAVAETLALVSTVVVAHFVSPAEFGRAAFALILPIIALALTANGFAGSIVQKKEIEHAHLEVTALLCLAVGAVLAVATYLLAGPLWAPLLGDRAAVLMQLAAPVLVITTVGSVPTALLQRQLRLRDVSLIEIVALAGGMVTTVALAVGGLDGESIVAGALVAATLTTALSIKAAGVRIIPRWHTREGAEVTRFGAPAAASAVAYTVFRNVDYLIIGARLGAAQLGFYYRAYQLGVDYQNKISGIMLRVSFPVFSRTSDLDHLRSVRSRIVRFHAALLLPLLGIYVVVAPWLVPAVFGAVWEPTVLPSQFLAIAGMLTAVVTGLGPLLMAMGRPDALLRFNVGLCVAFAATAYLAAPYGIVAMSGAVVVFNVVMFGLQQRLLLGPICGVGARQTASEVGPGFAATVVLVAAAMPTAYVVDRASAGALLTIIAAGAVGFVAYALVMRWCFPGTWRETRTTMARLIHRSPAPAPAAPGAPGLSPAG